MSSLKVRLCEYQDSQKEVDELRALLAQAATASAAPPVVLGAGKRGSDQ